MALLRENRLDEAKALCEDVCRTEDQPGAWYLLGIIHEMLRNPQEAQTCHRKAIALKPDYADAHFHLGVVHAAQGQLEDAIIHFQETTRLAPGHVAVHAALGNALAGLRRFKDAVASYQRALQVNPADVDSLVNLGNSLSEIDRKDEAVIAYQQAISYAPRLAGAYHNLGLALLDLKRVPEAIDAFRAALQAHPEHPELLADLGVALTYENKHTEAVTYYRQALSISPDNAETLYNLANAFWAMGEFGEAIASYQASIRVQPDDADAHTNLGLVYLSLGNFREGWKEYDWQWRRENARARAFRPTHWEGSNLGGQAVFLHDEQGLGDELFFLRFVPWLRDRGAGVISYRPSDKLRSLISRVSILDRFTARDACPPESALVFSIGDLPRLLGMDRVDQIPASISITPLPAQVDILRRRLASFGPPPYLGVTWRAGTSIKNALFKESPLTALAQALKDIPATVLVLQRQPMPGEIEAFQAALGRPAHDFSALNEDLDQMLALLSIIDDYVGVSNTNMHLRATQGKTARVLLPAPPEWRWMAQGRESPWFPGFTVYRQGYDKNWDKALAELATDLKSAFS